MRKRLGGPSQRSIDGPFRAAVLDYTHNMLGHMSVDRLNSHGFHSNPLILKLLKRRTLYKQSGEFDKAIRRYIARARPREISSPGEPLETNLARLGELLELTSTDIAVLQLAFAIVDNWGFRDLINALGQTSNGVLVRLVSTAIGRPMLDVATALSSAGRLVHCGLLELEYHGDMEDRLRPKLGLQELLEAPGFDRRTLFERFLPEIGDGPRPWLEHGHLEREIMVARELLTAALNSRERGINVLLYGDTGTGKTELARALAREQGVPLYAARRDDETAPTHRLGSLLLGLRIVEPGCGLVLFDELEDLFERSSIPLVGQLGTVMSKEGMNRLLEDNRVPVIWTSNHVRNVDRALLRRFGHAIEVRAGGTRQRARVLKHHLARSLEISDPEIDGIAERYEASPAQISAAVRAACMIGEPSPDRISSLLEGTCRLLAGRLTVRHATAEGTYCVDALNASIDLDALAESLAMWNPSNSPGVTMCLYGPPGTGKSEYVRYLARRLGRTVIVKRASDILSPFVGESEHRIARAFEQASVDDTILVFDEIDSLLRDRREAHHSWEVTQVNELLQQIEAYRGIVACTTNLWDSLDPAVLRRFVFKIELRPPTLDQAVRLFWAMLEPVLSESRTEHADDVVRLSFSSRRPAPGDLSAVRRRVLAMRARRSVESLLEEVHGELGSRGSRLRGFVAAGTA